MSDMQYIEVSGSALIVRPVEVHRGTIQITVTTRHSKIGLETSLRLRDRVIKEVQAAGIDAGQIEDAGGSMGHFTWVSSKRLSHELRIQHEDIQVFVQAMAAIERVFSDEKPGFFSGVSLDFSFHVDEPRYAKAEEAHEHALREAVANATRKASLLAQAAGVELTTIDQIVELGPTRQPVVQRPGRFQPPMHFDDVDYLGRDGSDSLGESRVSYTAVAPRQTTGRFEIRVRFRIKPV